jgi:hypothetical protein
MPWLFVQRGWVGAAMLYFKPTLAQEGASMPIHFFHRTNFNLLPSMLSVSCNVKSSKTMTTFKSAANYTIDGNWEINFFNYASEDTRGDLTICKEICSKLNVPTAAKKPWSPSNPQQANQPTAKRVFPNAGLTGQKAPTSQAALTLNKHGRDEEITGKQRGKKPILALSDGRTAWKKQQLVKKR